MAEPSNRPSAPRSLYHKEKATARPRMPPAPTGAPVPAANAPPPRKKEYQPGVQHLIENLRRFGIVFGSMIVLLALTIVAIRIIWAAKDRESDRQRTAGQLQELDPSRAAEPEQPAKPNSGTNGPGPRPTELDTERIRRAIFLAKHAQSLEEGGSLQEAIERYSEALEVWPHLNAVWGQLGRAYLKKREYSKAQLALEKAVRGSPGAADLMNDLGAALLYQGQIDRAMNLFDAAVEIDPTYDPSIFNLALCHIARNDRIAARASLEQYLRLRPHDSRALREKAFLDAMENQYDAALDALKAGIVESPDWALLFFDAAAVSALMGRMDQAIAYLQKAEPLSSPRAVYQIYREPAFREIRLTELGKEFEHELANRVRDLASEGKDDTAPIHPPGEPLVSTSATPK